MRGTGGTPNRLLAMRANRAKTLLVLALSGVLTLTLFISDQYLPNVPTQPKRLPPAVVTLGDSTLSGEGAGDYDPATDGADGNWCHRSPAAPVHQVDTPPEVTTINLACSGARADVVGADPAAEETRAEGSQAEQLAELAQRYRITAVVVQVGANDDPSFIDVVNRCVEAWGQQSPGGCARQLRDVWPERVEQMQPKVVSALNDVRTAMDSAGYTPRSYSLVAQSYASPVAPEVDPQLRNLSGCPFQRGDLRWIRDRAVPQLSEGIREAVDEVDARFLDLSRAATGREACTGDPRTTEDEWFTRLTVDWYGLQDEQRAGHAMQESFHANAAGHAQIGRCLGRFLGEDEQSAACLPDPQGDLRPVSEGAAATPQARP